MRPLLVGAAAALMVLFAAAAAGAAWPVRPTDGQHPIRGGFLDPRWSGQKKLWVYHGAVDVAVREDLAKGAPAGFVRRVYALASGPVRLSTVSPGHRCGRVKIGHITYGHVGLLRVKLGQKVQAGTWIARTCRGRWHVHILEFDRFWRKVNPLRPEGILKPYEDTAAPVIRTVKVVDGELRARIEDPQSFIGWFAVFPRLYNDLIPYRIAVDGDTVWLFDIVPPEPFDEVYSPETFRNLPAGQCLRSRGSCAGQHWFRLGTFPAGRHVVEAWDSTGNPVLANVVVP